MKERIVLPERMYLLAGKGEQVHLYYQNAVIGLSPGEIVNVICPYGRQYREFWRLEPGNAEVAHYAIQQGEFTFRLQLLNMDLEVIAEKTTRMVVVPKKEKPVIPMLCVGDSITREGSYVARVQESLPWIRTVGTRTYDHGKVNREGRGSWTAEHYVKRAGDEEGGDSPFLFPAGGESRSTVYWGNAIFWRRVLRDDPNGYAYDGFQWVAWRDRGGVDSCRLEPDGYPPNSQIGDTVCDPALGKDGAVCRWDGTAWTPLLPQPRWELDFARYLARFQVEKPRVVTFLFGANEFQTSDGIEDGIDTYLDSLRRLIDGVQECDPSILCIINLPVAGAGQDAWGWRLGCTGSEARYRRNIQEASLALLQRWDNAESRERGIYICPMLLVVDPYYGFDRFEEPVNKYVSQQVERHQDWVHPGFAGHQQMGDILAATVQGLTD